MVFRAMRKEQLIEIAVVWKIAEGRMMGNSRAALVFPYPTIPRQHPVSDPQV